jgi:hypothetical protein
MVIRALMGCWLMELLIPATGQLWKPGNCPGHRVAKLGLLPCRQKYQFQKFDARCSDMAK